MLLRVDGGEDEDAGDDVDPVQADLLHQLVSRDVTLECPDILLNVGLHEMTRSRALPRCKADYS